MPAAPAIAHLNKETPMPRNPAAAIATCQLGKATLIESLILRCAALLQLLAPSLKPLPSGGSRSVPPSPPFDGIVGGERQCTAELSTNETSSGSAMNRA